MKLEYQVPQGGGGRTVYTIMRRELMLSASLVRRLKNISGFRVNGNTVYSNFITSPGDIIEVDLSASEPANGNVPEHGNISVIWENSGLLAVNKPAGMLTHPSRSKYTGTLSNFVAGYLEEKGVPPTCHAVNRLDRDTSGVVLFAKNAHFKELASNSLSEHSSKEYIAFTFGAPSESFGIIDAPIKRLREGDMMRIVALDGQRAITEYRTLATGLALGQPISAVLLKLHTGRTHQIRVHMSHIGTPLLGDSLYCSEGSKALSDELSLTSQLLHAAVLEFTDPLSKAPVRLTAPVLREDIKKMANELKLGLDIFAY